MSDLDRKARPPARAACLNPAQPLWQVAPVRDEEGRALADFMMLIPGLGARSALCRDQVTEAIRDVCASFGERVAFANMDFSINVLWVSVAAEPGLTGSVARSIRQRVPDALLVGGQLGQAHALQAAPSATRFWRHIRQLKRRTRLLLRGPQR